MITWRNYAKQHKENVNKPPLGDKMNNLIAFFIFRNKRTSAVGNKTVGSWK